MRILKSNIDSNSNSNSNNDIGNVVGNGVNINLYNSNEDALKNQKKDLSDEYDEMKKKFELIRHFKPKSSRKESNEFYVIALNFNKFYD